MGMLDDLENLRTEAAAVFGSVNAAALEAARVDFLGNRGRLKGLLGRMGEVPKDQKPQVGKRANEIGAEIQALFDAAKTRVEGGAQAGAQSGSSNFESLKQERLDKLNKYKNLTGHTGWGERFPAAGEGALTPLETVRQMFTKLDPAQHTDPQNASNEVCLAARIMLRRDQSKKLIFLTVQDQSAQIQVALWNSLLDEKTIEALRDTLDLWDIVGIKGKLAFTQKGEPTVWATSARILSKCLTPPPDKHHGIHDKEIRYRQRYLDLISEPQSRKTFILRAKAIAGLRRFLDEQGFLEMETPVLQTIPGGAAARPFETHLNALNMKMYMRIATEIPLKKLLVGGLEKVYELGRIFRNEGLSPKHNPEFTSVEIYQAYGDLRDMMALTENAVSKLAQDLTGSTTVTFRGRQIKLGAPWPRLDYCELLKKHAGVTADDIPALEKKLREKGIDPAGLSHVDKIDGVFSEFCEPHLVDACFIINQPLEMSPLCRAHPNNPKLADRFEAFASGMEIANAYTELNDAKEQRDRLEDQFKKTMFSIFAMLWKWLTSQSRKLDFENDSEDRAVLDIFGFAYGILEKSHIGIPSDTKNHSKFNELEVEAIRNFGRFLHCGPLLPHTEYFLSTYLQNKRINELWRAKDKLEGASLIIDEDFLAALEHGMPPAGGLGIGVDRVVMLLAGADSIRDVILFPLMRPQTGEAKAEQKAGTPEK